MASFVKAVVNASQVPFLPEREATARKRFTGKANKYLKEIAPHRQLKFSQRFSPDVKAKFSAVVPNRQGVRLSLVSYVTGSDEGCFSKSIGSANISFEMIEGTLASSLSLRARVALIDNLAGGFQQGRFADHFRVLRKHCDLVFWDRKEELHQFLQAD